MTPQSRRAVLVTDAYWRKTVAAVRALGRAGAMADTADARRFSAAGYSRFCRRRFRLPDPARDAPAFLDRIFRLLRDGDYALLLPGEEATCRLLSAASERVPAGVWLPLPEPSLLHHAADKLTAIERAAAVGIPVPATSTVRGDDPLPVCGNWVVKPRSGTGAFGLRRVQGGRLLGQGDLAQLERRFGPLVLQEFVPGRRNGYGVSLLYGPDGACRAGFVHRKIRELPVSGGVSTCAESVARPDLIALARRYVEGHPPAAELPWQGVINLEFKLHGATGTPLLIEVNPRLWGSLPLAVRSGVDFPGILWRLSLGEEVAPVFEYRRRVRMRWLVYGELAHGLRRLFSGDVPWDILGEESEGDFLWDRSDPGPFWVSVLSWALVLANPRSRDLFRR